MIREDIVNGRCGWCGSDELYVKYHDTEWGRLVTDEKRLFEFLVLESAQAGLSWITILRKREGYRQAFCDFNAGRVAQMSDEDVEVLEYSAMLHDFGKIGIKDSVLCKKGKLTDEEYKHIQEHASITNEILKKMFFEEKLKSVPEIASSHHEKYNGMGYYRNIKGEDIPLGGRILAVSDVFDAITSRRHYRERMPFIDVLNILKKDSWSHFDGNIVEVFFKINIKTILETMLSRFGNTLDESETEIFSNCSLEALYEIFNKDQNTLSEKERYLIERFTIQYNKQDDDVNDYVE